MTVLYRGENNGRPLAKNEGFENPDWTKGRFFENAIKHNKLIYLYCAAHLVATLPITLGLAATAA